MKVDVLAPLENFPAVLKFACFQDSCCSADAASTGCTAKDYALVCIPQSAWGPHEKAPAAPDCPESLTERISKSCVALLAAAGLFSLSPG